MQKEFIYLGKLPMRWCFYADSTQKKIMKHLVNYLSLKMVVQPFELTKNEKQAHL